ncbi:MAG TPA: cytochrome c-type biogenesis protein [Acidimicrobiia bacterium]|nr:cytochrome c-type biogenesis protein [Acidimicrobiia bacterium]
MADTTVAERAPAAIRAVPWSVISVVTMAVALIVLVATYQPPRDTAEQIGALIRCPVCQGVPITDSPAPMARDMMAVLRQRLDEGASREEAVEAVLGAYPGSLLLQPRISVSTIALWLVPLVALVGGAGLALTVQRSRRGEAAPAETRELEQRLAQVDTDLDELSVQEAAGDIDHQAAHHLRLAYEAEAAETRSLLAAARSAPAPLPRSPRRVALGAGLLVGSLVVVVVAAGAFLVDRPGATSGVAASLEGNPADYSNETLAAVIAANLDHPQIDGMRLALAERHFESGDYQSAFPYFLDVASSEAATPAQAATALTRLGWMAYDGNGEVETALDLLAQARRLSPEDPFPIYLEGLVVWCGQGDAAAGSAAFRQVLEHDLGDTQIRSRVEADLASAEAGEECSR